MPTYRLRYRVESTLHNDSDIHLTVANHKTVFMFPNKTATENMVLAYLDVEAPNAQQAETRASEDLLPQTLDALSFATGTPLILQPCELILKHEIGAVARRALYVNVSSTSDPVKPSRAELEEAQHILDRDAGPDLALCWHRYAVHRGYVFDRFLFQWLALEGLAGTIQVPANCPKCGEVRTHSGTDKKQAYAIFSASNPEVTRKAFNDDIWGKARNAVFHGRAYPQPNFLGPLRTLGVKIRDACTVSFQNQYGLAKRPRPFRDSTTWLHYFFLEWETADPSVAYVNDFPEDDVSHLGGRHVPGEVGFIDSKVKGLKLLDINKDYKGW
jgi:hypothetical protein